MRITEIELYTPNLAAITAFYSQVLQWPVAAQKAGRVSFSVGYSMVHFSEDQAASGIYHFAMLLPRNQLQAAHAWIRQRMPVLPFDDTTDIADFANWNAQAFYFHDADKNILELIVHHDLPLESESPFSPQSLVGVCEIGLTVADVAQACAGLHKDFGIPYFRKGPYLPQFAVMGEEDGLLIVSEEGRGWIPTGQPSTQNKLRVVLENKGVETVLEY